RPFPCEPTAVHAAGDVHETPSNSFPSARGGIETCSIVQSRPFQRSARGNPTRGGASKLPTATHTLLDTHETALSCTPSAPVGTGKGCRDHARPFQRSANGAGLTNGAVIAPS